MQEPEGLTQSRTERAKMRSSRHRKLAAIIAAAVLAVAGATAVVWFAASRTSGSSPAPRVATSAPIAAHAVPVSAPATLPAAAASRVEVPDLDGMSVEQAATVLKAAGLAMRLSAEGTVTTAAEVTVRAQRPIAGTVSSAGSTVVLTVPVLKARAKGKGRAKRASGHYVIVIDAGHQSRGDDVLEPIGPGSSDKKPRVTAGSTGVTSGVPEYEIDLEIATNLQDRLEAAGIKVVMTRTTNDVDISNAERAQIANAAKAALFVRIHADSSADPKAVGVSTSYPDVNQWTKPIVSRSCKAAALIQQHLLSTTGAADGGSMPRSDSAGFNWSKVPSVLVQAGYQSNNVEDRLLSSAHYQDQLAEGIADGVLAYLGGGR